MKHRRLVTFAAVFVLAFLLILLLVRHFIIHKTYDGYTVLNEEQRYDNVSKYEFVEGAILRYSADGAALMRSDRDVLWNVTFNMTQPSVANCGEEILVYDKGNTDIRIYDRSGQVGQFSSKGPIVTACVSEEGNVACAISRGEEIEIIYYNINGEEIASIMTALSETGYPLSFALAPNGIRLAVAYVKETEGEVGSQLVFYDFGAEGASKVENELASETFVGTLLPELQFISNERLIAYRDNGFGIYRVSDRPEKVKSVDFDREIVSVFHDNAHFGFLFRSKAQDVLYDMEIYTTAGKKKGDAEVNLIYDKIRLCEDRILFLNGNEFALYDLKGFCHFDGVLEEGNVSDIIRTGANRYFVFTDMKAETIKLS